MCGFVGFVDTQSKLGKENWHEVLANMSNAIKHRGPDDCGAWIDDIANVGLAHQRLSIQDLSAAGHQPMHSSTERYVLVFNGEIYNHIALRRELNNEFNVNWAGHSDTETLLAAIEVWGLKKTLRKSVGMFALALFDTKTGELSLARDRVGEKPLYYGLVNGILFFGSELKAFKKHPLFFPKINRQAIALLMRHKYIPAPYSIYEEIKKLEPASILTINIDSDLPKRFQFDSDRYWSSSDIYKRRPDNSFTDNEVVGLLESKLSDSLNLQKMSDVPLGAFLSGGIDSSTIVALLQKQSVNKVKTFSVGFEQKDFNEAEQAKKVAEHLGTDHCELYVSEKDALGVIPKLSDIWDEPFADSSQIPTYLISKLASEYVTVVLSGDGGDELFGGYSRYQNALNLWDKYNSVPSAVLNSLSLFKNTNDRSGSALDKLFGQEGKGTFSHAISKARYLETVKDFPSLYKNVLSTWKEPEHIVLNSKEPKTTLSLETNLSNFADSLTWMTYQDFNMYLPDDVLVKVDRASMAASLETRVPLLDHRMIEFAAELHTRQKIKNGITKAPLRELLYKYVPKELVDRPKRGFSVPIDSWLRGPLKDWAESLLNETALSKFDVFNVPVVRKYWREHLSGKRNWHYYLWSVLMVQNWLENNDA